MSCRRADFREEASLMLRTQPIFLAGILVVSALAHAGETTVQVTGRLLEVNGHREIPRGLLGLHTDTPLPAERAAEWGVDGYRHIQNKPGACSVAIDEEGKLKPVFQNMPVVVDCQGDRFVPATVLTNSNYADYFRTIGREYAQRCQSLGWRGYVEFWNEPYLNWAERNRRNYDPKFTMLRKPPRMAR